MCNQKLTCDLACDSNTSGTGIAHNLKVKVCPSAVVSFSFESSQALLLATAYSSVVDPNFFHSFNPPLKETKEYLQKAWCLRPKGKRKIKLIPKMASTDLYLS